MFSKLLVGVLIKTTQILIVHASFEKDRYHNAIERFHCWHLADKCWVGIPYLKFTDQNISKILVLFVVLRYHSIILSQWWHVKGFLVFSLMQIHDSMLNRTPYSGDNSLSVFIGCRGLMFQYNYVLVSCFQQNVFWLLTFTFPGWIFSLTLFVKHFQRYVQNPVKLIRRSFLRK